jgi:hypothetical protein
MPFWFWEVGFGPAFFHRMQRLIKVQQSLMNMIYLLLPVSDWLTIMLDSGGLLSVVSCLFAVPVLNLWVGLEKVNN